MTGQSAKGMYDTFKRIADETMFESQSIDPYAQNHPMPAERMEEYVQAVGQHIVARYRGALELLRAHDQDEGAAE